MKYTTNKLIAALCGIIVILSGILIWDGCNPVKPGIVTVTVIDTEWIYSTDTQWLPPPAVVSEQDKPIPAEYVPSADCDSLKGQYNYLAQNYFKERVYRRTLTKDSITLTLSDTVENNTLQGSTAVWQVKYPQVTINTTTTITLPPVRQVYVGVGIGTTFKLDALSGSVGALYKSKKDNITGVSVGMDTKGRQAVEVKRYWKLKFER